MFNKSVRFVSTRTILMMVLLSGILLIYTFYGTHAQVDANHNDTFHEPAELSGYLWSSTNNGTGVGWISLNCTNDNSCATSNYNVQINPDKTATGYAWGENVGWVQFGGLNGCPSGVCIARVVGDDTSGYKLSGWARALAHSDPESGGWDGWISLNCDNHGGCGVSNYKVSFNSDGSFPADSNAWGEDVTGRVNFAFASFIPPCSAGNSCSADFLSVDSTNMWCEMTSAACSGTDTCSPATASCEPAVVINGELSFIPALAARGNVVEVSWTVDSPVDSCRASSNTGDVVLTNPGTSQPITNTVTTYTLYCIPQGGGAEVEVTSKELNTVANIYES